MKGLVKIILVIGFLVFAVCGIALAQGDKPGCKDHPMFTRMPNFYISNCEEKDYAMADFRDEKGRNIKVEGKLYRIDYRIKEGYKAPSDLQIIRNYQNAIKSIGGVIVK